MRLRSYRPTLLILLSLATIIVFQISILSQNHHISFKKLSNSINNKNYSSFYNSLFEKVSLDTLYLKKTLNQRCHIYFKNLYQSDVNWKIDFNNFDYDQDVFDKNRYIAKKLNDLINEKSASLNKPTSEIEVTEEMKKSALLDYNNYWDKILSLEQKLIDSVSHLRIFSTCYISNEESMLPNYMENFKFDKEGSTSISDLQSCSDIESRLLPWLAKALPVFKRWNGDVVIGNPEMSKYITYEPFIPALKVNNLNLKTEDYTKDKKKILNTDGKTKVQIWTDAIKKKRDEDNGLHKRSIDNCFLKNLQKTSNGKGIVLTVEDQFVDDTIKLIKVLRGLENKLPIEIVYKSNLSPENIGRIIDAGRNDFNIPKSFNFIQESQKSLFPPQEIWFVNCDFAISENHKHKFDGFGNKFLATLFNSFEEFILLDTDTVIFEKPDYYFHLKNYLDTGAFFFKDRFINEHRPEHDLNFFKKLFPSNFDNLLFDIPLVTNHTLDNPFFSHNLNHYMESGLVLMNKKKHFTSILMMIQLWFWEPSKMRSYGDKELFWLGLAINGDENYHFNKFFASAVGVTTSPDERPNLKAKEICTNRPAHINEDDEVSLLWMNSGFKFCKKDVGEDFNINEHFKFLQTPEDYIKYYNDKTLIRNAIIPPSNLENMLINTEDGEPNVAWVHTKYCNAYTWCAYDKIGGNFDPKQQFGKYIEYDNITYNFFDYLGDLWIGNE